MSILRSLYLFSTICLLLFSCNNSKNSILCDGEHLQNDMLIGITKCERFDDKGFNNSGTRTNSTSRSGKYSIKLTKDNLYGMGYIIKNVMPKEHFCVSVWRHHSNKSGLLVVSAENIDDLFLSQEQPSGISDGKWDKLVLDFIIPESMQGKLIKILVFHPGDSSSIYFDDLNIEYVEEKIPLPSIEKSSFIDERDQQSYEIIKIGKDWWMAENLNFDLQDSCFCYENNNKYCGQYGKLYSFNAAKRACPPGWRLPSDNDWKNLEITLGMTKSDADKYGFRGHDESMALREYGATGFNLKLSGAYANGFYNLNRSAYFWTSTALDNNYAYCREINDKLTIGRFKDLKHSMNFSVRCIKN